MTLRFMANSANVTSQVRADSLSIDHGSDGTSRCRFAAGGGSWTPAIDDVIEIIDDDAAQTVVAGRIVDVSRSWRAPGVVQYQISTDTLAAVLDARVVTRWLNPIVTGTLRASVEQLVTDYLAGTGLTFTPSETDNLPLGELLLPGVPMREAFDRIAAASGTRWFVKQNGGIVFTRTAASYLAAPVDPLVEGDALFSVEARRSARQYANRVWIKSSAFGGETKWTDTRYGDGSNRNFQTSYQITREPKITINGNPAGVIESGQISGPIPSWVDFVWMQYFAALLHNPDKSPLTASDEIQITYDVPLPYMAMAENIGPGEPLREIVVERNELGSADAMQQAAQEELAKANQQANIVTVRVMQGHWLPGMKTTLNMPSLGLSGTFVVESCSARTVAGGARMIYDLSLGPVSPQPTFAQVDPARYFKELLRGDSAGGSQQSRGVGDAREVISFVLAGTVEGLTNPGLTTGLKTASRVAAIGGKIRDVQMYFVSPPSGGGISVDVRQNGSSIFDGTKLNLSSGQQGPIRRSSGWRTDSIDVAIGDVFTVEVLTANAAAKDGGIVITLV